MDFFGIGPLELLVILVVALMVLGPEQLPNMAQKAGKFLQQARNSISDARETIVADMNAAIEAPTPDKPSAAKSPPTTPVPVASTQEPVEHRAAQPNPVAPEAAGTINPNTAEPSGPTKVDDRLPAQRRQVH